MSIGGQPPANLDSLTLPETSQDVVGEIFETIAMLGHGSAETLLGMALSDHGISESTHPTTSGYHRAALLWLADRDHARRIRAWWSGNVLVHKRAWVQGFRAGRTDRLPNLVEDDEAKLSKLVEAVLRECVQDGGLKGLAISVRPSPWSNRRDFQVIQVDIKRRLKPRTVEYESDDGRITKSSFRFLSDIVVILDPLHGAVHVSSEHNPRQIRAKIAQAVLCHFQQLGGEPSLLPEMLVHPRKLGHRPEFILRVSDRLDAVAVSELRYFRSGQRAFSHAIRVEDPDADLYTSEELRALGSQVEPFAADIAFTFRHPGRAPIRKVLSLQEPNDISHGHLTPSEIEIADAVLARTGLTDPNPFTGQRGPFDLLEELVTPQPRLQSEAQLGAEWAASLTAMGAISAGPPLARAHCRHCNSTHSIEKNLKNPNELILACPFGPLSVEQADVATLRFLPGQFAKWLAKELETDALPATPWREGIWDLGRTAAKGRSKGFGVLMSLDPIVDQRLQNLTQRIGSTRAHGALIVFGSRCVGLGLANGWKIVLASALISRTAEGLRANADELSRLIRGDKVGRQSTSKRSWPDVYAAYETIRHLELGPHEAEKKLQETHPDWGWAEGTVAGKLRKKYPGDFST